MANSDFNPTKHQINSILRNEPDVKARASLIQYNKNISPDHLESALNSNEKEIRNAAIMSKNSTSSQLVKHLHNFDSGDMLTVLNRFTSRDDAKPFIEHGLKHYNDNPHVMKNIGSHKASNDKELSIISQHSNSNVRNTAINNPNMPIEHLKMIATNHTDNKTRKLAANTLKKRLTKPAT